jgi:hypothetical protein
VSAVASCDHLSLAGRLSAEGFEPLVATLLRELRIIKEARFRANPLGVGDGYPGVGLKC